MATRKNNKNKEGNMNDMISRGNESAERLFPAISPDFYNPGKYKNLKQEQQSALKIVNLANQKYTLWEKLFGWNLDAVRKIGRLLLLHKKAAAAEIKGQLRQAEFFWERFFKSLNSIYNEETIWQELNEFAFHETGNEPGVLRQCMIEEVFIDMHCAFYNGRIKQDEEMIPDDRALFHIDYLEKLIDLTGISREKFQSIFDSISRKRIEKYKKEGNYEQAILLTTGLLERFPDSREYQSSLAISFHGKIMDELIGGNSEYENNIDADSIKKGIKNLEKFREKYCDNIVFYEVVSDLWHLYSIKLANYGKFSEALLSAQRALAYNPYMEEAKKTYKDIIKMMKQLKSKLGEIEREIANSYGMSMTDEGLRMKKEISKGSDLADRYRQSSEAQQLVESFYIAQARSVWHEMGFPEPPKEQWDEKAIALLNGLALVLENPPKKKSGIKSRWERIAENNTELEKLDPEVVCSYLERRLFKKKKSKNRKETFKAPKDTPIIAAVTGEVRQKEVPFLYWLFTGTGIRYQVQIVLVLILITIMAVIAINDNKKFDIRDKAFKQITTAEKSDDYIGIIENAGTFFSQKPLTRNDKRESYVKKLYDQAIVRLFTEQDEQLDDNALAHFKQYEKLIVNSKK